jgi:Protein of unknown function (DUF2510)
MSAVTPGWYADPLRRARFRWYDGTSWCEYVRSDAGSGSDPLNDLGIPRYDEPRWDRPAPAVAPPTVVRRRLGSGAKAAIWLACVGLVVLLVVGAVAITVLVRNAPRLTTDEVQRTVAAEMSDYLQVPVTVDCPPTFFVGSSNGTVDCTATAAGGKVVTVEVTVRASKVVGWEIVSDAIDG